MKVVTVRLPDDLNKQLAMFAKKKELSKNQVVKMAIRNWLKEKERGEA